MRNESTTDQSGYIRLQLEVDRPTFTASKHGDPDHSIYASVSGIRNTLEQGTLTGARVGEHP